MTFPLDPRVERVCLRPFLRQAKSTSRPCPPNSGGLPVKIVFLAGGLEPQQRASEPDNQPLLPVYDFHSPAGPSGSLCLS